MRTLFFMIACVLAAFVSNAQTPDSPKIGFADVDYIFSQMPEAKQIETELKSMETQLRNNLDAKVKEFQAKLADYQKNAPTMLEAVKANTERELQMLQDNLTKLQQDAQTTIQTKNTQLMEPVYDKVGKAIDDVAKENGFTLILNQQIGGLDVILYGDEKADVSDLVLKKMGITPKTQPTTQQPKN
jgi:outer membrane protein